MAQAACHALRTLSTDVYGANALAAVESTLWICVCRHRIGRGMGRAPGATACTQRHSFSQGRENAGSNTENYVFTFFPTAIVYKRWVNSSTTFVQGLAYVFTCPA